jgi:hypothetical protein
MVLRFQNFPNKGKEKLELRHKLSSIVLSNLVAQKIKIKICRRKEEKKES